MTIPRQVDDDRAHRAAVAGLRAHARAAGAIFLVLLVLGPFSILYVPGRLVESEDPSTTAANVAGSEGLLRLAIVSDTVIFLAEVAMAAVLYMLFRQVHRTAALMSSLARFGQGAVMAVNVVLYFLILALVTDAEGLSGAFSEEQRNSLALLLFTGHDYGVYLGQAFFGFHLAVLAYLIRRSGFVPPVLGTLMAVAAVGYLLDVVGNFVAPGTSEALGVLVGITALVGELPFFVWLLVRGVEPGRWDRGRAEVVA